MKKFSLFIVFLLFIKISLIAQITSENDIILYDKADNLIENDQFAEALPLYLKVAKNDSINPDLNYLIGVCYIHSNTQKAKAIPYFEQSIACVDKCTLKDDKSHVMAFLYLGDAYHSAYEFDRAIETYEHFKILIAPHKNSDLIVEANRKIDMCNVAKQLVAHPVDVQITNLGPHINTQYAEYSPVLTADEHTMIYTTRKPNSTGRVGDNSGITYEDIFIAHKKDTTWEIGTNIGTTINTEGNEASVGISIDGQIILIYKDSTDGSGNLYVTHLNGNHWSIPSKLNDNINTKGWEPSAFMSADEEKLYFVSNRPGGYGGRDIYVSNKLPTGEWAKATNLGPTINTPFEEDAPFIHPDGKTLYFSSNGHETMGGFDIFSSTQTATNQWEKPINIGYPINSPEDDIYLVVSPNKQRAYYSSFKAGGYGEKDIYRITFKTFVEPPLTVLKGRVTDPIGNTILGDVFITVTDNETGIIAGTYHANTVSGNYLLILPSGKNYNVTYEVENYLFQSTNIDVAKGSNYYEIHDVIQLQPLVVGSKIILKNLFFDFDKSSLRTASNVELTKLIAILTKYPNMVVEISAHTDSQGADAYNQVLSEQRAKSVVDFLIRKGIPSYQLVSKGFGETQPAVSNTNPDGSDNPVNRQLNRRVELKILSMNGAKNH